VGTYSEGNSKAVEVREETVHSVFLGVLCIVVEEVVVVVLKSAKSLVMSYAQQQRITRLLEVV
jgi:hypothetical protein